MSELEDSGYQKSVASKHIEPLTEFLESVQCKRGVRHQFEPYSGGYKNKETTLSEALIRIGEESPEETESSISGSDKFYLAPNQRYFLGASSEPQLIIVTRVSDSKVYYYSFPWKTDQSLRKDIAVDLMVKGCQTYLQNNKKSADQDLYNSISSVMNGRPGEKVSLEDFQFSRIQVRYGGPLKGDKDPWVELEKRFDVVVDSVLTNKQTYNIRMTNRKLQNFEKDLRKDKTKEFRVVRIVREEREYMLESTKNTKPKVDSYEIPEGNKEVKEYWNTMLQNNIAASFSAEGYVAGENVVYKKEKLVVVDFVPFDEDMTVILVTSDIDKVVQFVPIEDIEKLTTDKLNELECKCDDKKEPTEEKIKKELEKITNASKEAVLGDKKKVKKQELTFPKSSEDGVTQDQKALKESTEVVDDKADPKVEELIKVATDDADIFKNRVDPITSNLKRKRDTGTYDPELAVTAFRYIIDDTARNIFQKSDGSMFGDAYSSVDAMFPREVKLAAATKMRDNFEAAEMSAARIEEEKRILDNIQKLIMETEEATQTGVKREIVPFTDRELLEFGKISGSNTDTQNVVTFSWDSGGRSRVLEITKRLRPKENDLVYSAETRFENDTLDGHRTKDSRSFNTEDDLYILRSFISELSINEESTNYSKGKLKTEEKKMVDTTGLADKMNVTVKDVHPEELIMGIKIEMEHTKDREFAKEIALDHLAEIPDYYSRLIEMEKEAKGEKKEREE